MLDYLKWKKLVLVLGLLCVLFGSSPFLFGARAAESTDPGRGGGEAGAWETYTPDELKAALATLSDEQVRSVLLAELEKAARAEAAKNRTETATGVASILHHLEALFRDGPQRIKTLAAGFTKLPDELSEIFQDMTAGSGGGHLLLQLAGMIAIIGGAYAVETLVAKSVFKLGERLASVPLMSGVAKFSGAVLALFPPLFGLFIFAVVSVVAFLLIFGSSTGIRSLFGISLAIIAVGRLLSLGSRFLCAPEYRSIRLIPLDDEQAQRFHHRLTRIFWTLTIGYLSNIWLKRMGVPFESYIHVILIVGTLLILMVAEMVWAGRESVAGHLMADAPHAEGSASAWLRGQFAAVWHVLALGALFIMWFAWASRLALYGPQFGNAFIRSLLVVPLYLFYDRLVGWLLPVLIGPTGDVQDESPAASPETESSASDSEAPTQTASDEDEEGGQPIHVVRTKLPVIRRITRIVIILALLVWLLQGWNIEVPYIAKVANGAFDIVTTLFLALFIWRSLNKFISRKLKQSEPDPAEAATKEDDEWGGVVSLDRSHTLLPMLRKAIGMVMMVMVTLIVLSELGVNIGPLLAGAGVIGLAVGFGAQKLVADILSGFFFLMDDAFRVGEYIQASGVSGTVEAITLRNIMLRHHRGMLQIVPFSDLGSVTNFMRGGMVVKFNLELPYDTDIEKVRKTIKKVGKKMLQDPELGSCFIAPVKSQGVRSVGDSVMTFRVKFTAKPGKHFVIRREAFRRITEALEAKGIYYAHRKVIVELPHTEQPPSIGDTATAPTPPSGQTQPPVPPSPPDREQLIAGAAAGLETIINQETKEAMQSSKK